eukprot:scaffold13678_cov64-Phaeocystis_antarctica.AAC.2
MTSPLPAGGIVTSLPSFRPSPKRPVSGLRGSVMRHRRTKPCSSRRSQLSSAHCGSGLASGDDGKWAPDTGEAESCQGRASVNLNCAAAVRLFKLLALSSELAAPPAP